MSPPVRVLLVDDQLMVLEALASLLRFVPCVGEVLTATNSEEAMQEVEKSRVDIVVLGTEPSGSKAFDVAADLLQPFHRTRVIFLFGYISDVLIERALKVRASGCVVKSETFDALSRAIEAVGRGDTYFSPQIRERIRFDPACDGYVLDSEHALSALTYRQIEVLKHLAEGFSVKEIAKLMHLSQKAIDSHKYRIMKRLAIHDRVGLARYAIREELTQP